MSKVEIEISDDRWFRGRMADKTAGQAVVRGDT